MLHAETGCVTAATGRSLNILSPRGKSSYRSRCGIPSLFRLSANAGIYNIQCHLSHWVAGKAEAEAKVEIRESRPAPVAVSRTQGTR